MRKFLREYRIEIIFLFIVIIGLVIVFGRETILPIIIGSLTNFIAWLQGQVNAIVDFFKGISPIDLIAYVLILGGVIFVVWRARWRFVQARVYRGKECPKCGGGYQRIHRSSMDHLISKVLFLPLNRYRCANPDCDWTGLRKPGRRRRRRSSSTSF